MTSLARRLAARPFFFLVNFLRNFCDSFPGYHNFFAETQRTADFLKLMRWLFRGNDLCRGPYEESFQKAVQERLGIDAEVFTFGAARMGLFSVLKAAGAKPGDEVIIPAFTCKVVVKALLYLKIKPIYADIRTDTFNLDVASVKRLVGPKTIAIIAQHSFGVPCEIEEICKLAKQHGLLVIEDCALAFGSSYQGLMLGSFGDAAIYSTDHTKNFSTYRGGILLVRNRWLAQEVKASYTALQHVSKRHAWNFVVQILFSFFWKGGFGLLGRVVFGLGQRLKLFFDYYDGESTPQGYPCRMPQFQAYLGLLQLERFKETDARRRTTVAAYQAYFAEAALPRMSVEQSRSTSLRYSFLLRDREAYTRPWRLRMDIGAWFSAAAYGYRGNPADIFYTPGQCPQAEFVHRHIVNLPTLASPRYMRLIWRFLATLPPEAIITAREGFHEPV